MLTDSKLKLLGTRLIELRQKKGVSAALVATDALGYQNGSHVAVTRLERCTLSQPRAEHLVKLAQYFGVAPAYLFVDDAQGLSSSAAVERSHATPVLAAKPKVTKPAKTPHTLAERIAYVRRMARLDEAGFAGVLSGHGALIMRSDVLAWEAAERVPNPIQLRALGRVAEQSEEWFLEGDRALRVPPTAPPRTWVMASA